jgi:hypothetical protein
MGAKRSKRGAKKTVRVEIDADTLRALAEAVETLSDVAAAWSSAADDPDLRKELGKKGRRGRKRR